MVKKDEQEWFEVDWRLAKTAGIYVYLTLPTGEKLLVNYKPTFYGLLSFPKIYSWQKFDAYVLPELKTTEKDELFVNKNQRENYQVAATKGAFSGQMIARAFGPIILVGITFMLSPVLKFLEWTNIPPIIISMSLTLFLHLLIHRGFRLYLNKRLPFLSYIKKKRYVQLKVKGQFTLTLSSLILVPIMSVGILLFATSYHIMLILGAFSLVSVLFATGLIMPDAKVFVKINAKN